MRTEYLLKGAPYVIPLELFEDLTKIGLSAEEIDALEYAAKELGVFREKFESDSSNSKLAMDFVLDLIGILNLKPDVCYEGFNGKNRVVWANHYFFRAKWLIKKNSSWDNFYQGLEKICDASGENIEDIWKIPLLEIDTESPLYPPRSIKKTRKR